MRLQPIGRSLVIQVKPPEKKGILIVNRQDEPMQATIKAIGDKVEAPIQVGDAVLIAPYCGSKINGGTEDEPYLLIGEKEILGILRAD